MPSHLPEKAATSFGRSDGGRIISIFGGRGTNLDISVSFQPAKEFSTNNNNANIELRKIIFFITRPSFL
jgi:hypothetical protein